MKEEYNNFEIYKLTNSIEDSETGEVFNTNILQIDESDVLKLKSDTCWNFNWVKESVNTSKVIYKLIIDNNNDKIQGLISLEIKNKHVFIHLLENSQIIRGKSKKYLGVAGNMVAFAFRKSFFLGFQGFVSFLAKNKLIKHYTSTLGAKHIGGNVMIIDIQSSYKLVKQYYKDFDYEK